MLRVQKEISKQEIRLNTQMTCLLKKQVKIVFARNIHFYLDNLEKTDPSEMI